LIYRGEAKLEDGQATIQLPNYFEKLVDKKSRTIQLTPKNGYSPLYLEGEIKKGKFTVKTTPEGNPNQEFYWMVQGKRGDEFVKRHPFKLVVDKPVEKIGRKSWKKMKKEEKWLKKHNAIIELVEELEPEAETFEVEISTPTP